MSKEFRQKTFLIFFVDSLLSNPKYGAPEACYRIEISLSRSLFIVEISMLKDGKDMSKV